MSGTDHLSAVLPWEEARDPIATMRSEDVWKMEDSSNGYERVDSGLEDTTETPRAIRSRSASGTIRDHTPTPTSRKRKSHRTSRTMSSSGTTTSRSSSRVPTITPDSSRPATSHRSHSRHSSASTSARRSSKRPSLITGHAISTYGMRQSLPHKDSLASYIHLYENPFLPHRNTAPTNTLDELSSRPHLRSPSLPNLPSYFPPP